MYKVECSSTVLFFCAEMRHKLTGGLVFPELCVAEAWALQHKGWLGGEEGAEEDDGFGAGQAHLLMCVTPK